jgi:hypothetical protein
MGTAAATSSGDGQTRWIRVVLVLAMCGISAELLLISHEEGWQQQIPLYALGCAVASMLWLIIGGGWLARRAVQAAALALIAASTTGLFLHFQSNYSFKRELSPDAGRWTLFVQTMRASSPPALAPGALAAIGAIGFLTTLGDRSERGDEGASA